MNFIVAPVLKKRNNNSLKNIKYTDLLKRFLRGKKKMKKNDGINKKRGECGNKWKWKDK